MNNVINSNFSFKQKYIKPAIMVVFCKPTNTVCASGPEAKEEVSTKYSYSRGYNDWDDEEE